MCLKSRILMGEASGGVLQRSRNEITDHVRVGQMAAALLSRKGEESPGSSGQGAG